MVCAVGEEEGGADREVRVGAVGVLFCFDGEVG